MKGIGAFLVLGAVWLANGQTAGRLWPEGPQPPGRLELPLNAFNPRFQALEPHEGVWLKACWAHCRNCSANRNAASVCWVVTGSSNPGYLVCTA